MSARMGGCSPYPPDDVGGYKADEPAHADPAYKNMWRTSSWRNVALTAADFHNGSVANLDEAVRVMGKTQLNLDLGANRWRTSSSS